MRSGSQRQGILGRLERWGRRLVPSTALLTRGPYARLLDAGDAFSRVTHPEFRELPPNHLRVRVGTGNRIFFNQSQFQRLGSHACLDLFARGWLDPDSSVIDIGCGCGRTAAPLRQTAAFRGSYLGIDVDPEMIAWCSRNLADGRFRFELAGTRNSVYNPSGTGAPYRLPVTGRSQDLIFSHSLFTHLLEAELVSYVRESARALKPDGVMAMTVFCLDHEDSAAGRLARFSFRHRHGEAMVEDPRLPEAAVAYSASYLERVCVENGFASAVVESSPGQSRLIAFPDP